MPKCFNDLSATIWKGHRIKNTCSFRITRRQHANQQADSPPTKYVLLHAKNIWIEYLKKKIVGWRKLLRNVPDWDRKCKCYKFKFLIDGVHIQKCQTLLAGGGTDSFTYVVSTSFTTLITNFCFHLQTWQSKGLSHCLSDTMGCSSSLGRKPAHISLPLSETQKSLVRETWETIEQHKNAVGKRTFLR